MSPRLEFLSAHWAFIPGHHSTSICSPFLLGIFPPSFPSFYIFFFQARCNKPLWQMQSSYQRISLVGRCGIELVLTFPLSPVYWLGVTLGGVSVENFLRKYFKVHLINRVCLLCQVGCWSWGMQINPNPESPGSSPSSQLCFLHEEFRCLLI